MSGKKFKITAVISWLAFAALLVAVYIYNPADKKETFCWINRTTGLHCPGCGATRAVYYLMRFNFKKAFYYHAYGAVIAPFVLYVGVALTVNLFAGKKILFLPKFNWAYYYVPLALLMVFTVLRNFTAVIY